jgi:cytochrome c oxidase cbb3-type subunit 1
VIINFFKTHKDADGALRWSIPMRWFFLGAVNYFVTCLQCAFQVTLTFQALIHFTDWVVGHAHLVMFGVFSMWLLGIMTYLFPRLWRTEWYSRELCEWHYWLSALGWA